MQNVRNLFSGTALVLYIAASLPAFANDSTAVLGAGGLELTVNNDVVMEREDLYLSSQAVHVVYLFKNESKQDITTRVAFPMPEVSFGPTDNFDLPNVSNENFVGFSVSVDNHNIKPTLEVKAISAPVGEVSAGKLNYRADTDITDKILQSGLPINANSKNWHIALKNLSANTRTKLIKNGLLYDDTGDGSVVGVLPQWSMRETYHWNQTFPAEKPVKIEHRYKPVVGSSFFTGDAEDLKTISAEFGKRYCLDKAGMAGIRELLKKAAEANMQENDKIYLFAVETEYILKTGANWKGDIGQFHMTIDKSYTDAIMSTCFDGVKKSGLTTFTVERTSFKPEHDIRFVVFRLGNAG